jgi:hypothetical protein
MSTALITGLVLCLVEAGLTTALYSMGRLKHYSYALNHCFLWPLLTWVVVMWWNKPVVSVLQMFDQVNLVTLGGPLTSGRSTLWLCRQEPSHHYER